MDEPNIEEEFMSIRGDYRWAKAIFACLEKVEELAKTTEITKEKAEIVQILANTARILESTNYELSESR